MAGYTKLLIYCYLLILNSGLLIQVLASITHLFVFTSMIIYANEVTGELSYKTISNIKQGTTD